MDSQFAFHLFMCYVIKINYTIITSHISCMQICFFFWFEWNHSHLTESICCIDMTSRSKINIETMHEISNDAFAQYRILFYLIAHAVYYTILIGQYRTTIERSAFTAQLIKCNGKKINFAMVNNEQWQWSGKRTQQ